MAGRGDKCEQKTESRGFCNKKGIRRQVVAMPTKTERGDRDDSGVEGKGGFAREGTTSRRIMECAERNAQLSGEPDPLTSSCTASHFVQQVFPSFTIDCIGQLNGWTTEQSEVTSLSAFATAVCTLSRFVNSSSHCTYNASIIPSQ